LEKIEISWFFYVKSPKNMQNVLKKSPNFSNHKTVFFKKNNLKNQTSGIDMSKEEMNSTSKMLEVLGKRLHQV
jgi:hypothetical protein